MSTHQLHSLVEYDRLYLYHFYSLVFKHHVQRSETIGAILNLKLACDCVTLT